MEIRPTVNLKGKVAKEYIVEVPVSQPLSIVLHTERFKIALLVLVSLLSSFLFS